MAQDIKRLLQENQKNEQLQMPKGHEKRFMKRLDNSFPKSDVLLSKNRWKWLSVAASIVVILGVGFTAFLLQDKQPIDNIVVEASTSENKSTKTLGDVSPDLKKIEDYYMASINYELSKVNVTSDNKELFDGCIKRLEVLNQEYKKLSDELTKNGPNEFTVNALINNLKMRLNLLYRLKEQLETLSNNNQKTI